MMQDPVVRLDDPVQDHVREWFLALGSDMWIELLSDRQGANYHVGTFCALAPTSHRARALSEPSWDLHRDSCRPGFSQTADTPGRWTTTYERFSRAPVEPLVIDRQFHGVRPRHNELSEEFRLYHDLAPGEDGELLKIDDAGIASVVARVRPDRVVVLTKLVRQYQAARQLDLLLFIYSVVDYDPAVTAPDVQEWKTDLLCAQLSSGDRHMERPFSRFLAVRVIPPPPITDAGVWPFEKDDTYFPEFVIGTDGVGDPRTFTCRPDQLANYFGANPAAPHYLTPVHFRREVLAKYYGRPDLYTVSDGYLRCAGLWGVRIDNDIADRVVVFLGDLGRDIPASERDYWRSFNIAPTGTMSPTAIRRSFLAQFTAPGSADLQFRTAYPELNKAWRARFNWPLFRDPEPGDAHLLGIVRRPLHDTDGEFEELVRTLTKLLVDSLNEKDLDRVLAPGPKDERGITKLKRWLEGNAYAYTDRDIAFLRDLQEVRSKGAAHRKGSDYERTLDKVFGRKRRAAAGEELLARALTMVLDLTAFATVPVNAIP